MSIMAATDGLSKTRVISDFRRKVDELYALLGYYAAYGGDSLPTFRDNSAKMGPIFCPETSVSNYQ